MIHSILPAETILGQGLLPAEKQQQIQHIAVQNGFVRAYRDASGQSLVESLFSTDPHDYLDPRYQPGTPWQ